jgi:hypothetical protein
MYLATNHVYCALLLTIIELLLHFSKDSYLKSHRLYIINLMWLINIYIFGVLIYLYRKTKQNICLVPILLAGFIFISYGHNFSGVPLNNSILSELWAIVGGINLGVLGSNL